MIKWTFQKFSDYSKPLTDLKKEDFSKIKRGIPNHEDIAVTSKNKQEFDFKMERSYNSLLYIGQFY